MRIGELARRGGVTIRTVRYYVEEGLLPLPPRRGQYAEFDETYLQRLQLILRLKEDRLTLPAIRDRLAEMGLITGVAAFRVRAASPEKPDRPDMEGEGIFRSRFAEEAGLSSEQVAQLETMGLLESQEGLLPAEALPFARAVSDLLSRGATFEDVAMIAVYVRREARLHRRLLDQDGSTDALSRALQWQEQVGAVSMLRDTLLWRWARPGGERT